MWLDSSFSSEAPCWKAMLAKKLGAPSSLMFEPGDALTSPGVMCL